MPLVLFDIHEIAGSDLVARGLSLPEAFARVMALSGYERWAFTRTARTMHLVMMPLRPDAPLFESELAIDRSARTDIMAQVCAHGLGRFVVTRRELPTPTEASHEYAA